MGKSKFEGLTRHNVAFHLKNKFHASFAAHALRKYGEEFFKTNSEILNNPKGNWKEYLKFEGKWFTGTTVFHGQAVLKISDLVPFLEYLGCKPKLTKETLDQIDQLHAEETTDYVTSKKIGPDEPINNKK